MGIERAEEAVNNSVGEAAGEFFQNIGEVPVSTSFVFLYTMLLYIMFLQCFYMFSVPLYTVVVYNVEISAW